MVPAPKLDRNVFLALDAINVMLLSHLTILVFTEIFDISKTSSNKYLKVKHYSINNKKPFLKMFQRLYIQ